MSDPQPFPFTPANPPVSPAAVQRPARKSAKAKKPRRRKSATGQSTDAQVQEAIDTVVKHGRAAKKSLRAVARETEKAVRGAIGRPGKKPRKVRQARPVTVPIHLLPALAGMKEGEASMLMSIIGNLQDVSKASRRKIVAALGKMFA